MEEAFVSLVLAAPGLSGLVGDRVTWGRAPQGSALPLIVLNKIDRVPEYADEGEVGLSRTRMQLDCYAATYAEVRAVARAVLEHLSGVALVHAGVDFQGIYLDAEREDVAEAAGASDRPRVSLDFMILHD